MIPEHFVHAFDQRKLVHWKFLEINVMEHEATASPLLQSARMYRHGS